MFLPPDRGTLHGTSEEVEDGTDGTYVTMDVQLIPMRVRPLLQLWHHHANPEQIRVGSIDSINPTYTSSKSTINKFVVVLISLNEMLLIIISFVTHKVSLPFKKSSQILR